MRALPEVLWLPLVLQLVAVFRSVLLMETVIVELTWVRLLFSLRRDRVVRSHSSIERLSGLYRVQETAILIFEQY